MRLCVWLQNLQIYNWTIVFVIHMFPYLKPRMVDINFAYYSPTLRFCILVYRQFLYCYNIQKVVDKVFRKSKDISKYCRIFFKQIKKKQKTTGENGPWLLKHYLKLQCLKLTCRESVSILKIDASLFFSP
ncbi:Protein of unknown function [Gryllus bimaculatus]|nr:Protein of unknown function [Gryllus bimaculatus]